MKRIGFYGGSFNPPHCGHQATILHALTTARLDELIVAPVYKHPYGKELVDFGKRYDMCRLMLMPFHPNLYKMTVSGIERDAWEKYGTGFTAHTVHMLIEQEYKRNGERPHVVLILGSDCRDDLPNWDGYDQLMELCKCGWLSFFFVDRISGLSSTAVRAAIAAGGFVDRWLPREVHNYIHSLGLYKDSL
jgi:nicotinate-nucleotide adenylyltransferase